MIAFVKIMANNVIKFTNETTPVLKLIQNVWDSDPIIEYYYEVYKEDLSIKYLSLWLLDKEKRKLQLKKGCSRHWKIEEAVLSNCIPVIERSLGESKSSTDSLELMLSADSELKVQHAGLYRNSELYGVILIVLDASTELQEASLDHFVVNPLSIAIHRIANFNDINDAQRRLDNRMRIELRNLKGFLEATQDAIVSTNEEGQIITVNEAFEKTFKIQSERFLGKNIDELGCDIEITSGSSKSRLEAKPVNLKRGDGSEFLASVSCVSNKEEGIPLYNWVIRDISEIARLSEKIQGMEDSQKRDVTTGLYNRKFIIQALENEITLSTATDNDLSIVLFKEETYTRMRRDCQPGEADKYLAIISRSLSSFLRDYDQVGRYGEDIFLMILPNTKSDLARVVCQRIERRIHSIRFKTIDNIEYKPSPVISITELGANNRNIQILSELEQGLLVESCPDIS